jgi:hypothetical protein
MTEQDKNGELEMGSQSDLHIECQLAELGIDEHSTEGQIADAYAWELFMWGEPDD